MAQRESFGNLRIQRRIGAPFCRVRCLDRALLQFPCTGRLCDDLARFWPCADRCVIFIQSSRPPILKNKTIDHSASSNPQDQQFPLFEGVDPEKRRQFLARLAPRSYAAGETVLAQGSVNDAIYLVESGTLEVSRLSNKGEFQRTRLGPGECFGEMSAFSGARTTATLRAESAVVLRLLKADELPDEIRPNVLLNISKITIGRLSDALEHLQQGHEQRVDALRTQLASTVFASRMLWALSIYVLLLPLNLYLKSLLPTDGVISLVLTLFFFGIAWTFVTRMTSGFAEYGMLPKRWWQESARGVWLSSPVLAAVLLAKYVFLRVGGSGALFEPMRVLSQKADAHWWHWAAFAAGYVTMSYAQEFIRCATQGSLAAYYRAGGLVDRWKSVAVATIVFAAMHVHLSAWFALIALVAGLYWGWMYQREKSYWGVAASHAAIGLWSVFVVGVPY